MHGSSGLLDLPDASETSAGHSIVARLIARLCKPLLTHLTLMYVPGFSSGSYAPSTALLREDAGGEDRIVGEIYLHPDGLFTASDLPWCFGRLNLIACSG